MKKLITLALVFATSLSAKAQLVNGGMETWRTLSSVGTNLEAPDGWFGSDSLAIWAGDYYGGGLVTLDQQIFEEGTIVNSGNASAKIETHEDLLLGIIPGILSNAQPQIDTATFDQSDPFGSIQYSGGTPVAERIYYVNAYVRYESQDLLGDEYGALSVEAVKVGQGVGGSDLVIGTGTVNISPTAGSGFEGISAAVVYTDDTSVPDMLRIAFISTADMDVALNGSILYVDDVSLSTASIKNTVKAAGIKCFPNPVNDGILNITNTNKEKLTLNVVSATGQLVNTMSFSGNTQVSLSALTNGMYFVNISDASGQVIKSEKLMLNK